MALKAKVYAIGATRAADDVGNALNYYPTPPWAARAGGELIQRLDPGDWNCWEPACGEGHMAHGLDDYFPGGVIRSDVADYGAGAVFDFLSGGADGFGPVDWIVTNPPFRGGEAFVRAAIPRARRGVAMLMRLAFLEGQARYRLLYGDHPVTVVAPFAERVPMRSGYFDPEGSTATAYAWFVWQRYYPPGPRLEPIAPGARRRLTRPVDQVFGASSPRALPALAGGERRA